MQTINHTSTRAFLSILAFAILASGCATSISTAPGKPAIVDLQKHAIERSTARWKALTDKRYGDSFGFLSDASKLGITASEYGTAMQHMGVVAATIEGATCDAETCTVKSIVTLPIAIRNVGARLQKVSAEERWVWNNGELWLIRP